MDVTDNIHFDSANRKRWLKTIESIVNEYRNLDKGRKIILSFSNSISVTDIEPVHLVTLACVIQYLFSKGHTVYMSSDKSAINNYIYNDLNFRHIGPGA